MLDSTTKHRIDNARDVLVGKVPDPKAQVEQITTALIYKFMDDMDQESISMGGHASFFVGEYEKFAWPKIMAKTLGGYDRLGLYSQAISEMNQNPNLPPLFRDVFKDAFLPYKDPETLNLFLKEIDGFKYDHSERLGDAFEYLLSVLGSQGAAGQFRTPRHIIDFIVEAVGLEKTDSVLDPACGTAGFLISAYKHILAKHQENKLSPDEMAQLTRNFVGYDIAPEMVRLSLVNMYLHKFPNPTVFEYDTLTSEDRWDDTYDVILANPPFMTPKGGIRPHSRFSIRANRSEVLFVDYIAEHLNPEGRAGIIVPEGIIFQSSNAYKALRKMLVEGNYLYAVVSLPAGVFNPYSGVKTSILLLDKKLAKQADKILFVKIENDGFDLGAQRREIEKNNLPEALNVIGDFKCIFGKDFIDNDLSYAVDKSKIAKDGEFNLSASRYIDPKPNAQIKWPAIALNEILNYEQPTKYIVSDINYNDSFQTPVLTAGKSFILGYTNETEAVFHDLPVIIFDDFTTASKYVDFPFKVKSSAMKILKAKNNTVLLKYIFYMIQAIEFDASVHRRYWISNYSKIKIPLPPLEVQREIVEEIEGYQKIIDGARMVVENWKPRIKVNSEWPMIELGKISTFIRGPFGGSLKKEIFKKDGYLVYEQSHAINDDFSFGRYYVDEKKFQEMQRFRVSGGDLLISCSGTMGKVAIVPNDYKEGIINQALLKITINSEIANNKYVKYLLESDPYQNKYFKNQAGSGIQNVSSVKILQKIPIPLPSLQIQENLIYQIEQERDSITALNKLINNYINKINDAVSNLWGEKKEE